MLITKAELIACWQSDPPYFKNIEDDRFEIQNWIWICAEFSVEGNYIFLNLYKFDLSYDIKNYNNKLNLIPTQSLIFVQNYTQISPFFF